MSGLVVIGAVEGGLDVPHRLAEERQKHWRDLSRELPELLRQQKRARVLEITRILNGHASDVAGIYDRAKSSGVFGARRRRGTDA